VCLHLSGPLVDLGQSAESPQDVRKPPSVANGYQHIKAQVRPGIAELPQVTDSTAPPCQGGGRGFKSRQDRQCFRRSAPCTRWAQAVLRLMGCSVHAYNDWVGRVVGYEALLGGPGLDEKLCGRHMTPKPTSPADTDHG
jgi:hypothetical protein